MYQKCLFIMTMLACGHVAWNYYDEKSKRSQPDLAGYKPVGNALSYDGVSSVGDLEHVYLPERHSVTPSGIINLANFERVDSQRTLKFTTHLFTSELLMAGENLFKGKKKKKLLRARAYLYGQDECKRLKATFVSSCKVQEMKISYNTDDKIHIGYEFGFVQNLQFGDVSNNAKVIYEEEHIHFYEIFDKSEVNKFSLNEQEKIRLKYYRRIVESCQRIRKLLGTCAVDSVKFNYILKAKEPDVMDAVAVDIDFTSLVALEHNHTVENIK